MTVHIAPNGYLYLDAALVESYFSTRSLVALMRGRELWLLPVASRASGGLLLKQRNRAGDCCVLVWEGLPEGLPGGSLVGYWDALNGALRLELAKEKAV
jgi:hypothetical protein